MRLLADENFPLPTIEALEQAGHDVTWVRTDAPGTGDTALLDLAEVDGRVLLTLDKDFWQIAIQRRQPLERSGVILFRIHPATPENVTPLVLRTFGTEQEWSGHASVVTIDRVLMVRLGRREAQ
jgi:predicted nuclease of predicted toxin-antitoxin system